MKKGDVTGCFPAWPEEAEDMHIASDVVDWSEISIIRNTKKKPVFNDINELFQRYKVGTVKTYVYPKEIDVAMSKYPNHSIGSSSEMALLKMLAKLRFDVAITDPNVMLYLAGKEGIGDIEEIKMITKKELVVLFKNDEAGRQRCKKLNSLLPGK